MAKVLLASSTRGWVHGKPYTSTVFLMPSHVTQWQRVWNFMQKVMNDVLACSQRSTRCLE